MNKSDAALRYDFNINRMMELLYYFLIFSPIIVCITQIIKALCGKFDDCLNIECKDLYVYSDTVDSFLNIFYVWSIFFCTFSIVILSHNICFFRNFHNFFKKPWIFLFALLLFWAGLSTLQSNNPIEQTVGYTYIHNGYLTYLVYASVFVCSSCITDELIRKKILIAFIIMITLMSFIMILQETHNAMIIKCFPTLKAAIFQNRNYLGYLQAISISALVGFWLFDKHDSIKHSVILISVFLFQSIALIVNDTLGCIIAVFVFLLFIYLFYIVKHRRLNILICLPFIIFLILIIINMCQIIPGFTNLSEDVSTLFSDFSDVINESVSDDSLTTNASSAGSGRWGHWKETVQYIINRPIFGYGPEGFGSPHNDILEVTGYLGIPGAILYLSALVTFLFALLKRIKSLSTSTLICLGMIICYLISAQFGHPVFNTTPYFYMVLGMANVMCPEDKSLFLLYRRKNGLIGEENKERKKDICMAVIIMLLIVAFAVIAIFKMYNGNENKYEESDLQGMRCAELTTKLDMANGFITEKSEYWYDMSAFQLIPIDEDIPSCRGQGTSKKGGALEKFIEEYSLEYDYDESIDYTDKIIKVIVDPSTENIILEWVVVD